jgi:hypothetical protein
MAKMEQLELEAHRNQIIEDVNKLVEKYRSIFEWDVPEVDQAYADKLILAEIRSALENVEKNLLG